MRKLLRLLFHGKTGAPEDRQSRSASTAIRFGSDTDMHRKLRTLMKLYNFLSDRERSVIRDFVRQFYVGKDVYIHPDIEDVDDALLVIAANAALVGAAQNTHCFSSVRWIYLCSDDLEVDGDAYESSTVRLDSDVCVKESRYPRPGENLVVHEFAHILDAQFGLSSSTRGLRDGFRRYVDDIRNGNRVPIADCFTDIPPVESFFDSPDAAFHTDIEFFASVSEAFFTNAYELRQYNRQLYGDLSSIYGLDLAELNWQEVWKP